jgi:putative membrane protein
VTFTTATTGPAAPFSRNRLLQGLALWYVVWWVVLAIAPIDRGDWLLENILAVTGVTALVVTYRWFRFSDLSYVLLTVFVTLHAVGAHYTYAEVPLGHWLKDAFHLSRNHFDRLVHFAFGLLLAYPIREFILRAVGVKNLWAYYAPVSAILAFSGFFEIVESWVAMLVSPELGQAYLGTQGDIWDAQKDMTAALVGAITARAVATAAPRRVARAPADL